MSDGWAGAPKVEIDGQAWPLDFAAQHLDIPLPLLKEIVKWIELEPAGCINMRPFKTQGRIPRAYNASQLAAIYDKLRLLKEDMAA
jgi:hypothetical protein